MASDDQVILALGFAAICDIEMRKAKKKRNIWQRKWLQWRIQLGCYENLMKELALGENCNGDSHAGNDIHEEAVSKNKYLEFAYKLSPLKGYDLEVSYTRNYPLSIKGLEGAFKKRRTVDMTYPVREVPD
ncbi:hypothetical protein TNCV_1733871 [Trichonephila clavipes]|nr:hypothetical protein TNCV_1733871 [Trichonephila clavipes]